MKTKQRLDLLVLERGLAESRQKAQALIMAGLILVDGQRVDKVGTAVKVEAEIRCKGESGPKFVSRGGHKLQKAIEAFDLRLHGVTAMDAGASTGGFTDCMLQHGAEKVYAVDVGYGQLAWSLRTDPRVLSMERCNVRHLTTDLIPEPLDFVSMDLSFISLTLVLPAVMRLLKEDGSIVALVKPQFEAGREAEGKKGVVRDPAVHLSVLREVCAAAQELGLSIWGLTYSPIRGPEGNIEYLAYLRKETAAFASDTLQSLVAESHEALGGERT